MSSDSLPHISKLERVLTLTELVKKYCGEADALSCVKLAKDLARVIDELRFAKIDLRSLSSEFFNFFPEHWKKRTQFLLIVTKYWSEILKEKGKQDVEESRCVPLVNLAEYPAISPEQISLLKLIEAEDVYDEINRIIAVIKEHAGAKLAIVSPNLNFAKYLAYRLQFEGLEYVSLVANEVVPEGFREEVRTNFQNEPEQNLARLIDELSDLAECEKPSADVSICGIHDLPNLDFDITVYTGLNEAYWRPRENGYFWLHNSLRKKLNFEQKPEFIESLFHFGISRSIAKSSVAYLSRAKKCNGESAQKSAILAKLEARAKKAGYPIRALPMQTSPIGNINLSEARISRSSFKLPSSMNSREIEELLSDPYAFYAHNVLGLTSPVFDTKLRDIKRAFRGIVKAYFSGGAGIDGWLEVIKQIDFFAYKKAQRLLGFLQNCSTSENAKNNLRGQIALPDLGLEITTSCDRIEEGDDGLVLISYGTSSAVSLKDLEESKASLLTACLIAERGGFAEIRSPIRKIQVWNLMDGKGDFKGNEFNISEGLIQDFEKKLKDTLSGYSTQTDDIGEIELPSSPQKSSKYKHFKRK
ncbi:MAG: hypothetical protein IJ599_03335 [Alphaproteobacteria bacterium]|nr:hypothetical protein [Alphaproteobacteria bacterium]